MLEGWAVTESPGGDSAHACLLTYTVTSVRPLELEDDGDLFGLVQWMICSRVNGTFCISEVKGHVEADLVRRGQVREVDRDGVNRADEAADFGWRRVGPDVIDARRNLCGVVGGGTRL